MKKRKRVVMDFVEVPPLSSVYRGLGLRHAASLPLPRPPPIMMKGVRRSMRRASLSSEVLVKAREVLSEPRANKRRKLSKGCSESNEGDSDADAEDSTPVRGPALAPLSTLTDNQAAAAAAAVYYPYNLARKHAADGRVVPSSELSSDDDPRLGQVTPYHLISPELRRAQAGLRMEDPPSDDSVLGSSPSKALVERKLRRMGSGSASTTVAV
ncbi:hypothetical protein H0H92_000376 [Tricholoma furcatifolium]|nr:hypothetical protein H0H92_000376 [Tricholoma furcatifolium]